MGGSTDFPEPTEEELALQSEQLALLRFQSERAREQSYIMDLMAPLLYEQAGIRPIYSEGTASSLAPNPERARIQAQIDQLRSGAATEMRVATDADYEAGRATLEQVDRGIRIRAPVGDADRQIQQLEAQLANLPENVGEAATGPQITGFEEIVDPTQEQREEIERLLLERTEAALRGELPVNPALLRDLETAERDLNDRLRSQLGSDYATSSPGIEALGDFEERQQNILEGARRGDITMAEGLALARSGQLFAHNQTQLASQAGIPSAVYQGQGIASVIAGQQGALNNLYQNRAMEYQGQVANNASTMQGLAGLGALGATLWTGGAAAPLLAGVSAGANLGSGSGFSNLFAGNLGRGVGGYYG